MNFQAVDDKNGKNVTIWATLKTWDGIAFTTKQAKYLSCRLTDDNNVEHKCRIYEGKGTLPGQENLEKRMEFSLSTYQGNYKGQPYTGYSGFWSHGAVQGSQNSSQSSQESAQATNSQQQGNDVEIRKCVVCALLADGGVPAFEDIEYWMEYIQTGIDPKLPGKEAKNPEYSDDPEVPEGDIPF